MGQDMNTGMHRQSRVSVEELNEDGSAVLGKYRMIAKLGRGGMADVFLAAAKGLASFNKLVVVKRHRPGADGDHVAGFLDEAKLSARLNHPNVVQTYEVGEDNGAHFIVMEYLEGQPLNRIARKMIANGPDASGFSRGACVRIVADMLSGLHHAHELADYDGTPLGIVHRDVSPQNTFVTYEGVVKLVDFGIAKAVLNTTRTEAGMLKGKLAYMAPEQITGNPVDRRADVFAAGLVLWELVAGRRLREGSNHVKLLRAIEPVPRLSTVVPDVAPALDDIVAKAVALDPIERFATAQEMRAAL
jgi:serine/threonine protein kinase